MGPRREPLLVIRCSELPKEQRLGIQPHGAAQSGREREVGVRGRGLSCPPECPPARPFPQLVSLASEVQDLHVAQRKEMASGFSKGPPLGLLPDVPSLMETLSYSYCYVGIMTGERARPGPASARTLLSVLCSCPQPPIPASAALSMSLRAAVHVSLSHWPQDPSRADTDCSQPQ